MAFAVARSAVPSPRPDAWSLSAGAACGVPAPFSAAAPQPHALCRRGRSRLRSPSPLLERPPSPLSPRPRPRPEPPRPDPPWPPLPRPRPKRPRFFVGAVFRAFAHACGQFGFADIRSINFSMAWNFPCSSSLDEGHGSAGRRGTRRTADAVDIIFGVVRHVVN